MSEEACSKFEPHPIRKLCKSCRLRREAHPLYEEDVENVKKNLRLFADQSEVTPHVQYAWTPPGCSINRLDEYFQKFLQNEVPRHKSEGQENRLKRLIYQLPLSDLSLENCRFVEPTATSELESYIQNLHDTFLRLGTVTEWSQGMPVQCPKCLLILEPNELVVTTEPGRSGDQAFHPSCFVCFQCQDFLGDLIHCSDIDGAVFCLRHYNESFKKRCHACDELIFSSHYALAGEKFYHRSHLLCFACDKPLESNKGLEKEGELYCGPCYQEKFCSDCSKCLKRISVDSRHIAYQDKNWHYDCFTCNKCGASMADDQFEIVDGEFMCIECYNKNYAPKCGGCEKSFDQQTKTKVVQYEDKIYHVPCFKCVDCQETIGTGSFVTNKDRVYCKDCHLRNFGIKCFRCTYTITDEKGIMYNKKAYHEECFTCHKCLTKIANRPFKNVDEKWYCMNCYGETFCKKCHSCEEPILLGADQDILYSYKDYQWHSNCFICSLCKTSLADTPFIMREKALMCKTCLKEDDESGSSKTEQATEQKVDEESEIISS